MIANVIWQVGDHSAVVFKKSPTIEHLIACNLWQSMILIGCRRLVGDQIRPIIGDQKWSQTATIWWWLLKPLVQYSQTQTHRQVIKDNLRLLPTKLISSRFSVLHQHPIADNIQWETLEDLWGSSMINKNLSYELLRIRKTYGRSEVLAHLYWS